MQVDAEDYLQDVAFDYYNKKMAVCSSDRRIRVYKRKHSKEENMNIYDDSMKEYNQNQLCNWELESTWEAHDAPVLKIIFSSPEFGSLLASCGYDKKVNIWQEKYEDGKSVWISKAKIQEFSENVEDISFCSKVFGLKLAICTSNGKIKIFEPKDYFFYVNWNCTFAYDINLACSSICWNPSALDPQSFVVGCYLKPLNLNNKDNSFINVTSNNNIIEENNNNNMVPNLNSTNEDRISESCENLIQIFVFIENQKDFVCKGNLFKPDGHNDSITYIEWAPQFARSYHLISSCSLDKKIKIWKFYLDYETAYDQFQDINIDQNKITLMLNVECDNPIYRVSFNLSGTILCSTDSKGVIKIFKKRENEFKELVEFHSLDDK